MIYDITKYLIYISFLLIWIAFIYQWRSKKIEEKIKLIKTLVLSSNALLLIAMLTLIMSFVILDYSLIVVYENADNSMSVFDRMMAAWAVRQGAMLLWALFQGILTVGVIYYFKEITTNLFEKRTTTILIFFNALTNMFSLSSRPNMFETHDLNPVDGLGLTPSLLNFWQQLHPPIAFLSYSAFIVPYAIGLAGLSLNMKGSDISDRNRWLIDFFMIVGWVLTTLFLVAGSIWAYEVDWGGYWQWDPVQVSSIVLWLMATLYFHIKPMMGKEYSIHFFSAALGWVGVTFAAFIVRGGLIEGPHQYIGTAQFIVFGLLLLGTVVALAFASMKSDFEIIPDWFFSPSMVKNKKSLYTIWILVTAIIFNVTCITLQIIYAQMGTILTNLSPLYGTMNGIFLLAIAFILILYESDVLGISKQKFTYFIIGSFLISLIWALISISNYNRIGFIFFILFSTCFFTQLLNLMSPIIIKANSKNTYLRLMHFVILFTLLMYASTDPNTESVEVDITMNQSLVIDSFDAIVSLKEVNNGTYATVILEITNLKGNNPNEVLLQQGIYKTSIWIKGDWISYSTHDLFFKFNGIQNLLFSTKLNTISLIIKYVPNSFLFKINFNLMLIVGIIGIHKKLKERAK